MRSECARARFSSTYHGPLQRTLDATLHNPKLNDPPRSQIYGDGESILTEKDPVGEVWPYKRVLIDAPKRACFSQHVSVRPSHTTIHTIRDYKRSSHGAMDMDRHTRHRAVLVKANNIRSNVNNEGADLRLSNDARRRAEFINGLRFWRAGTGHAHPGRHQDDGVTSAKHCRHLTSELGGRPTVSDRRPECTISPALAPQPTDVHGPLQRKLGEVARSFRTR